MTDKKREDLAAELAGDTVAILALLKERDALREASTSMLMWFNDAPVEQTIAVVRGTS